MSLSRLFRRWLLAPVLRQGEEIITRLERIETCCCPTPPLPQATQLNLVLGAVEEQEE